MARIYLDYNATAPIRPEVIARVGEAMRVAGNASSIHGDGRSARKIIEDARSEVAALVGVQPAQVIFNSGATEGNNTILSGYKDKRVLILAAEHPSVLEAAPFAQKIPVTKDGAIDLDAFEKLLPADLVCVQLVNSETGVIQPLAEVSALCKKHGALLLCDAVQAAGRIALDFTSLGADYMTLSAHKFGGPQGVGALIFRTGLQIPKFLHGGGQEKRQRAGTENIAGIAGMGAAAKIAAAEIAAYQTRTKSLQAKLESALKTIANDLVITGENAPRVSNTTNVIIPHVSAETMLMALDLEGVSASSGSACSSGTFKPSHVLTVMGYSEAEAKSALRFSTGWATTEAEIDAALDALRKVLTRVRK
ncbi:MAG: cysteine desulfurase [Micavibrio aeruginosavorus]|uniref:Cysteine desulfurase n=1 Tax=Micavibrio aeruginosavorus TaxID=349221 RepID=A0A2W5MYP8_9BACT|nr:MAG: cysteine desulfurase [Micavibrio aeruginosavorus]